MNPLQELLDSYQKGHALPSKFYTSPEIFEEDIHHVYNKNWIFAGHINEIPVPGDFVLYQIARDSLILVRDYDENIKAFINVCRHRGSPLCIDHSGNIKEIVCPYHNWVYNLSGHLISAKRMPKQFDNTKYNLHQCNIRVTHGLIFICLSDSPPDFDMVNKYISPFLKPHGFEKARICYTMTRKIRANWKIVTENSWECYHCPVAHPLYAQVMPYARVTASAAEREKQEKIQREWEDWVRQLGYLVGRVELPDSGIVWCQRNPVKSGFVTQSKNGQPVAPLMGEYREYDRGVTGVQFFPICWFAACNDYVFLFRLTPVSTMLTEVKCYWLVSQDAREGIDYITDNVVWFWKKTVEEDIALCERTQMGVSSSWYVPGPFSEPEIDVEQFIKWYLSQLRNGC